MTLSLSKRFSLSLNAAAMCLIAALFAGCGQSSNQLDPDRLIFARGNDAVTLDPGSMEDGFSANVAQQIFEGLVKFKNGSLDVEPALADRWETSDDGRVWTFHLREGVKFHDGTPLTSEAVVTSLMRLIDPKNPYHLPGRMPYADMALNGIVKNVEAVDGATVRVNLYEPYAPLLKNLAMFCCFISSPRALEQYGEDYGAHPVGAGPYQFAEWKRDVEIVLKRNPDYWGEAAKCETAVYRVMRDPEVRLFSVARGEASLMDGVNPQIAKRAKSEANLSLVSAPGVNLSYAYMNLEAPPFNDKRVRQALNYAVNKKDICEHLFEGYATPMRGIFPPGVLGHDPDSHAYEYDPEKAKALLAEANFEPNTKIELLTYSAPRPYNSLGARLAEVIQSDLAAVGVNVSVVQVEWGTLLQRTLNHNYQIAMLGWSTDNGDPDNFAYALLTNPNNRSQFHNEAFNQLVIQGQREYDEAKRLDLYRRAQAIAIEEAPWLFINTSMDMAVIRNEVKGFMLHPMALHFLWPVSIANPAQEASS
ncbi:MAG: ABC transporter substrate-binding protein [bacterium]|nr:ABC transporter substrate-binding protein [bacterium]